ncbi:MAG: hypothetical protein KAT40_03660 [Bacteroidales bacterium]|nr:hypothetical protein [Bacteroidales bacterium]
MQTKNFYKEKIFSKWTVGILSVITAVFFFLLFYQILVGPIGTNPAPNWFFLFMFLLFLGMMINFSRLTIKLTPKHISVGYGVIKHSIPWENVEDCYLDEASTIKYGGWGIRIAKVKGKWRLVYNVVGGPRIVLSLKRGRFKEFAFSTKNPEEVIKIAKEQIGIKK